jgi:hypothetical protein
MAYGARPVPQNIMSVEFKIFDFMTLKQFGISVALLIFAFLLFYILPAPWNIVIPLLIIVFGGIIIFVPFNGEPFQDFLSSYMEAMISPQRRVWHKKGIIVKSAAEKAQFYRYGNDPVSADKSNFNMPLQDQRNNDPILIKLEDEEKKFMQQKDDDAVLGTNKTQNLQQVNYIQTNISPKSIKNSYQLPQEQSQNNFISHGSVMNSQNQSVNQQQSQNVSISNESQNSNLQLNSQATNIQSNPQNSQNFSATANIPQSIQEPHKNQPTNFTQTIAPQNTTERDESSIVKNYIFGSVEKAPDKPAVNAIVTVFDSNNRNLEFITTNVSGEFKTSYEYEAGNYRLNVNYDGKELNDINIIHEPIDPAPVIITPKEDQYFNQDQNTQEVSTQVDQRNDGVFDGAYDAGMFNLGHDYLEQRYDEVIQNQRNQNQISQEPDLEINYIEPGLYSNEGVGLEQKRHSAYSNQANNLFNQMRPSYYEPETQAEHIGSPQSVTDEQFNPQVIKKEEELNSWQSNTQESNLGYYSQQKTNLNNNKQIPSNDVDIVDFLQMPNANVPFEQNLISVPGTINGILVGPNGYGLDNCNLRIINSIGEIVTSMQSDNTGRFYSYSPLEKGYYTMFISKGNQNLVGFKITITGQVIQPKYINFSY